MSFLLWLPSASIIIIQKQNEDQWQLYALIVIARLTRAEFFDNVGFLLVGKIFFTVFVWKRPPPEAEKFESFCLKKTKQKIFSKVFV